MALTRLGPNQSLNLASNVTGTLPTANGGTGATSFAKGKIVQKVINRVTSNTNSTSGGTYTDTGLTATITPTSSSNKILVIPALSFLLYRQNATHRQNVNVRIVRGSTAVETWGNDAGTLADTGLGTYDYGNSAVAIVDIWSTIYEDTPNTTSSTTYKIQISNINTDVQFSSQHGGKASTMTLLEVEA